MVSLLFLVLFCIFFFLPVQFRLFYRKVGADDTLRFEMRFLNGLLKRKWQVSLLEFTLQGLHRQEEKTGKWFFVKKRNKREKVTSYFSDFGGWQEFLQHYRRMGLGMLLLSFFLPVRYRHWFLVTENLEKRGRFSRFKWQTCFGTGDAAVTAYCYGWLWGIKALIVGTLGRKYYFSHAPELAVIPDFHQPGLEMLFDCIFQVKLGYIILASLLARLGDRLSKGGGDIE